MYLVVAATSMELAPLQERCCLDNVHFLVSGVGLVETAFHLTRYLQQHAEITKIIHVGIGGGFPEAGISVLDSCLATLETIGDLGVCFDSHTLPLDPAFLPYGNMYHCQNNMMDLFSDWLHTKKYKSHHGSFLSVNGVSGTTKRGAMINHKHSICENMEGAAVARVCLELGLDWFEFRVISNLVENRDLSKWQVNPAIDKYTEIIASFLEDNKL